MKASDYRIAMTSACLFLVVGIVLAVVCHGFSRDFGFVLIGTAIGRFTMRGRIKVLTHD